MSEEEKLNWIRNQLFGNAPQETVDHSLYLLLNHIKASLIYNKTLLSDVKDDFIQSNFDMIRSDFLLFVANSIKEGDHLEIIEEIKQKNPSLLDLAIIHLQQQHNENESISDVLRDLERNKTRNFLANLRADSADTDVTFEKEITSGMTQVERNKAKKKLKKLDTSENNRRVFKLIFYPIAVAASIAGIVFFAVNLQNNNNDDVGPTTARVKPKIEEQPIVQNPSNHDSGPSTGMVKTQDKDIDPRKKYPLKFKSSSIQVDDGKGSVNLGYSPDELPTKRKYITLKFTDLAVLTKSIAAENMNADVKKYYDSLIVLKNSYRYDGNTITLYINPGKNLKVNDFNGQVTLIIDGNKYLLEKSTINKPLKRQS